MLTKAEREEGERAYKQIAEIVANAMQSPRRKLSFLEQAFRDAAANPGCLTNDNLARAMYNFMLEVVELQTLERSLSAIHFQLFHRD